MRPKTRLVKKSSARDMTKTSAEFDRDAVADYGVGPRASEPGQAESRVFATVTSHLKRNQASERRRTAWLIDDLRTTGRPKSKRLAPPTARTSGGYEF